MYSVLEKEFTWFRFGSLKSLAGTYPFNVTDLFCVIPVRLTTRPVEKPSVVATARFQAQEFYECAITLLASSQDIYGDEAVRILSRPGKMGLGTAYMDGLRMISGTHVILMDADMSHHPK